MALLYMDGFDAGDFLLKYNYGNSAGFSSSATTRFTSGRSLYKAPNNSGTLYKSIPSSASIIVGFAAHYNTNFASFPAVFAAVAGDGGATAHIHVATGDTSGTIEVSRGYSGSRTVLFTTMVPVNTWNYYELRVKVADAGGYADLKVNGAVVGTFSGDTKNGGTSTNIDNVIVFGSGNNTGINVYWDDFYIIDETGSAPYNTYLGDVRVQTLVPNAAGNSTQFTPSIGANYTTVDELPYSATDYVASNAPATRDTYTMADLPASTATIFGVQTNVVAKKTDAGAIGVKPVTRTGGTNYYGFTTTLSSSDVTLTDIRAVDPNTSVAWTAGGVNGMKAGMEVA